MSQTTEQNVRTREEQVADLIEALSDEVWVPDHKSYCEKMILEAEARGTAEQRRKDAELSRAKMFCQNEQEASDRTPERPDVVQWQRDRNEFFLSSTLEVVTEYAAWRDKKDAEGQEPIDLTALETEHGFDCDGGQISPGVLEAIKKGISGKVLTVSQGGIFTVSPYPTCPRMKVGQEVYLSPANVAALEARAAKLEKALSEIVAMAEADCSYDTGPYLKIARAALTREGGM